MRPSRKARTVVGYQPVGMYPRTLLLLPGTSATATALASEHATYRVRPSPLMINELGVMPTGCRGVSDRFNFSDTLQSEPSCAKRYT